MLTTTYRNQIQIAEQPLLFEIKTDLHVDRLVSQLYPDHPWGVRRDAAIKLGSMRSQAAVPYLLATLPFDPFWMVRYAIIQALQQIGDPAAIPTLEYVAEHDTYQVVRSFAERAIRRIS